MSIQEATKQAVSNKKAMYRDNAYFVPTDGHGGVWVMTSGNDKDRKCPRWQPKASDLMANDWDVVDLPDVWDFADII